MAKSVSVPEVTLAPSLDASQLSSMAVSDIEPEVLPKEKLAQMYRDMYLIRRIEESLLELAESGKIGGAMHTAIGHEAAAIGTAAALQDGDYLTSTYRGHHHSLARGMGAKEAIAEVLGRSGGFAKGKGGSMHFYQPELGLMGANGIVGAQVPHAAGMALASKLRGDGRVAITFFGDGANYQGLMHETFNMSQKWQLPVIFFCENNRYSEMTPISNTSSVEELYLFVRGYGMNSIQIDGNDVEVVYTAVRDAAARARAGDGPTYIEGLTYRLAGHMANDLETYRTKEEVAMHSEHESVVNLRGKLLKRGIDQTEIDEIQEGVEREVVDAVEWAENSPWPELSEAYSDVYKR
ncbi:MAG: thiamine pyrophosphate-dependent dehydrogenase E1 component subunit alpha [Chloroflexota bacterium]